MHIFVSESQNIEASPTHTHTQLTLCKSPSHNDLRSQPCSRQVPTPTPVPKRICFANVAVEFFNVAFKGQYDSQDYILLLLPRYRHSEIDDDDVKNQPIPTPNAHHSWYGHDLGEAKHADEVVHNPNRTYALSIYPV
ncbi:hypothetical protein Hypma_009075 [Hypsizygus marmoreus]|uniref:Uncharacterized protein n=1 Tax=Hypsizygus marmoreus TaxID=39966 RepID=A0A369JTD5_HYPMA|nr:hypothetical protein Hypma_009075 [Hypsizygus marmoreus]